MAAALVVAALGLACRHPAASAQPVRSPRAPMADAAPVVPVVAWDSVAEGVRVARTVAEDPVDGAPLEWLVARIDLARAVPVAAPAPGEAVAGFATDPSVLLAVDGGYFEPDHRPSGTLFSEGHVLGVASARAGTGLLVIDAGRTADVLEASTAPSPGPGVRLAVQCGPRLIERDGSVGIVRDDHHRFARTAACVRDQGHTLDLVLAWSAADTLRGPGLLAFARLLHATPSPTGDATACERALNLDGGPSTGAYVRGRPALSHDARGPVPFALVVRTAAAR